MFDIGWTELMVIACIAIIVVGPKDLPRMLRSLGKTLGQVRRMSREFQSTFNDALRDAEREADILDMKKQVEEIGNTNPLGDLKKSIEDDFNAKAKPASNGAGRHGGASAASSKAAAENERGSASASADKPDPAAAAPAAAEAASAKPVAEDSKA